MSRIGKKPVVIPSGVKVNIANRDITVEGKNGRLNYTHRPEITVKIEDDQVIVERANDSRESKAFHGLTRSLIDNMVTGVTEGYKKELEIVGVGWNANVKGMTVELKVGYHDTRKVEIPMGVKVDVQGMKIAITGPDKQKVGQCAAQIRAHRKPEPYNGKGIRYSDEIVVRKQGKAFAGGG